MTIKELRTHLDALNDKAEVHQSPGKELLPELVQEATALEADIEQDGGTLIVIWNKERHAFVLR